MREKSRELPLLSKEGKRLLYRATHRGTRELDLMLGSFARAHLAGFGAAELEAFAAVLKLEETDLQVWLLGQEDIPSGPLEPMLRRIRDHCLAAGGGLCP